MSRPVSASALCRSGSILSSGSGKALVAAVANEMCHQIGPGRVPALRRDRPGEGGLSSPWNRLCRTGPLRTDRRARDDDTARPELHPHSQVWKRFQTRRTGPDPRTGVAPTRLCPRTRTVPTRSHQAHGPARPVLSDSAHPCRDCLSGLDRSSPCRPDRLGSVHRYRGDTSGLDRISIVSGTKTLRESDLQARRTMDLFAGQGSKRSVSGTRSCAPITRKPPGTMRWDSSARTSRCSPSSK